MFTPSSFLVTYTPVFVLLLFVLYSLLPYVLLFMPFLLDPFFMLSYFLLLLPFHAYRLLAPYSSRFCQFVSSTSLR